MQAPTLHASQCSDYFRSLTLLADLGRTRVGERSVDEITEWLMRFDKWYKETTGLANGDNLHLAYRRHLTLLGSGGLQQFTDVESIAHAATILGFQVTLRIAVSEAIESDEILDKLVASRVTTIILDRKNEQPGHGKSPLRVIEKIVKSKYLIFKGAIDYWLAIGIGKSLAVNSFVFRIVPDQGNTEARVSHGFDPCYSKFQLFVDSGGNLYPCAGLVGLSSYALGKIDDDVGTLFDREYPLNLEVLAQTGPRLGEVTRPQRSINDYWPSCALHRSILEMREAKVSVKG